MKKPEIAFGLTEFSIEDDDNLLIMIDDLLAQHKP